MPKSVHITTSPLSFETEAKRLRIPKKRQKELLAIADKFWKQWVAEKQAGAIERKVKPKNASAAD